MTGTVSRRTCRHGAAKVGDALGLIGALGKKYMERKQYAEAEPLLKRYVEISGDEWAYQELAACYTARGDARRAKETLDNYLNNTESAGLQHAQVQVQMANKLMSEGTLSGGQALCRRGRGNLGGVRNGLRIAVL